MFLAFWYPIFFCPEKWFFGDTNSNLDLRISSLNTHLRSSKWSLASYISFLSRNFFGWILVVWPDNFSSWIWHKKLVCFVGCSYACVFFLDFRQRIVPATQKKKIPPTRNRTRDLRISSFTTVLRSTNWAIGRNPGVLSDRFVRWSDCLWLIHVSSQHRSRLLCSSRFFS